MIGYWEDLVLQIYNREALDLTFLCWILGILGILDLLGEVLIQYFSILERTSIILIILSKF